VSARFLWAVGFAIAAAGCSTSEKLSPLPDAGPIVPPGMPTLPLPDGGPPPKRTVIERNPFGDVAVTQNLLWDGDFEWSSAVSDEYGWWENQTTVISDIVVGPACKSGIKCARIKAGSTLLGIAVSSSEFALQAWVYTKFEDKGAGTPCSKVLVALTSVGVHGEPKNPLTADPPDADGWCKFSVMAPQHQDKVFLQIRNIGGSPLLVDDAAVVAVSPLMVDSATFQSASVPTAEDVEEAAQLAKLVASHAGPHDVPPTVARRMAAALGHQTPGGAP